MCAFSGVEHVDPRLVQHAGRPSAEGEHELQA
jgi:hypothetical protein